MCKELKAQTVHRVALKHQRSKYLRYTRIRNLTVQSSVQAVHLAKVCIATREMDARTAYETFMRKRVSDTHWSSVKRTLTDSGMEINPDTVVFFAKLRKEIPRASVGILQVFECYQKAEKLLAVNSSKITGSQILDILVQEGINPHPATVSRWFKSLGGFRKTRFYFPEKLTRVLTSAFIYKIANSTKLGA